MRPESIDLILTDPPYNISRKNNFNTMRKVRQGIDFGEWDKGFDLTGWIKQACKLLKPGGSIIIFTAWCNLGAIAAELEKCKCSVKRMLLWRKTNPMPRNRDRLYVNSDEYMIWATKGKGWVFNRRFNTYESGVFEYPFSNKERIHPTQKPILLLKDLIEIHSNKGDIIFDPFSGSASTGVAAIELGRNFIGCELNKEYYKSAKERIKKVLEERNK